MNSKAHTYGKNGRMLPFITGMLRYHAKSRSNEGRRYFIDAIRTLTVKAFGGSGAASPVPDTPLEYTPVEIVYLCLQVSSDLECSYLAGSGVYWKDGQRQPLSSEDIQAFALGVQSGNIPSDFTSTNLYSGALAPDIALDYQCYLIVQLVSSAEIQFLAGSPAIEFLQTPGNSDPQDNYAILMHLGNDGQFYQDKSDSSVPCSIFYVWAGYPDSSRQDDYFNYYIEVFRSSGTDYVTLDPCIKNQGDIHLLNADE